VTVLLALYILFVLYVAVMGIMQAYDAKRLKWPVYPFAITTFVLGVLLDFVVNVTLFTLLFLEFPRHWLITKRLASHIGKDTWRGKLARWICDNFLHPFDEGHCK
jgi:hypothetical protein